MASAPDGAPLSVSTAPDSSAPARAIYRGVMTTIETVDYRRQLIGGEWVEGHGGELESIDPFRRTPWAVITEATEDDVDVAVRSARETFASWRQVTGYQRAKLLFGLADVLEAEADELGRLETRDNGKIVRENQNQIRFAVRNFRFFAGLADKFGGETKQLDNYETVDFTTREPRGVVVLIAPWNSPIQTLSNKLAPALAAGNVVIIKPSEHTTASTLELGRLFERVGFPPGVVSVLSGGPVTGHALTSHPDIDLISFTGGIEGARRIAANAAQNVVPLVLELGGKGANIIFEDANLERAIPGAVSGIFAAAGQTCVAGSRLLVHESVYEKVIEGVAERARHVLIGDPMQPDTQMGPIANLEQHAHVGRMIGEAIEDGARLYAGGQAPETYPDSWFIEPTIFSEVAPDMRLAQNEVFGPVLAVMRFHTDEEAIALANGTRYGLAAGLWSESITRAHRVARELETGTVWINTYRTSASQAPFGGVKRSGYGRERGVEGLMEYLRVKNTMIDLSTEVRDPFLLGT
jgi:(Z)-2-((N-methylformamido)methylene)-5-hydroxybutyrolactone dehydrogenase